MKLNRQQLRGGPLQRGGRRNLEMTLEELTTYLDELIENSPVAILMLDPEHRVQMYNPAFERLFQYKRHELMKANLEDLNHVRRTNERGGQDLDQGMTNRSHISQ